jgi:hypothetical protein
MTTKCCKVIRGTLEVPVLDDAGDQTAWPDRFTVRPGELADLPTDEAIRLAGLGAVEIMGDA